MIAFKNNAPFNGCITHRNDEHIDTAENTDLIFNMYNLIEYSDNYSDSTGTIQNKEKKLNAAGNINNINAKDSLSFEYKSNLLKGLTTRDVAANVNTDIVNADTIFLNAQIVVPLKYLSNFFRSLEMPLINCKLQLELNWTKNSVMSNVATASTFQITSTKLYVPIISLQKKDNLKLTKLLKDQYFGMNIKVK